MEGELKHDAENTKEEFISDQNEASQQKRTEENLDKAVQIKLQRAEKAVNLATNKQDALRLKVNKIVQEEHMFVEKWAREEEARAKKAREHQEL